MLNPKSIKARPRSWWCRRTVTGPHAIPLADLIQEAGCFEFAIFFVVGAGLKPVLLLALVKLNCTHKSKVCKSCSVLKYLMEEVRPAECRTLKCVAGVDSTACKGIMLRHGVGQLRHLATRTMWAQQILVSSFKWVECGLERSWTTMLIFPAVQSYSTR